MADVMAAGPQLRGRNGAVWADQSCCSCVIRLAERESILPMSTLDALEELRLLVPRHISILAWVGALDSCD